MKPIRLLNKNEKFDEFIEDDLFCEKHKYAAIEKVRQDSDEVGELVELIFNSDSTKVVDMIELHNKIRNQVNFELAHMVNDALNDEDFTY